VPRVSTASLLAAAVASKTALVAFNVVQLETVLAVTDAAGRSGLPVVLQISENAVRYYGSLRPLAMAALAAADGAAVPVAVHLDHATGPGLVAEAIELGLSSVMYDASRLPLEQNIAATRLVAALCHDQGVLIEGELGEIGGKAGAHAPDARTDPGDAARYVRETEVDALAVAIGSQHAMTTQTARLDLDLLGRIRGVVGVPLVLHGSSGVPAAELRRAVAAGITKVNVATLLSVAFTAAVRQVLTEEPETVDPRRYLRRGRAAATVQAAQLLASLRD
jgi:fructose-bisphosphate aldolase, class II